MRLSAGLAGGLPSGRTAGMNVAAFFSVRSDLTLIPLGHARHTSHPRQSHHLLRP